MNTSSWQAVWLLAVEVGAVVLLTLLITWRLRSVVWQRTLWQASLIALIGLLVVEFSSFSFRKVSQMATPGTEAAVETTGEDLTLQSTVPPMEVTSEPIADYQPAPTTAFVLTEIVPEAVPTVTVIEESPIEERSKQTFPLTLAIVLGVWVVGSVVLAMRLLVGRFLLLRFCARSRVVSDETLFGRVQGIAQKLGLMQPVQVMETAHIKTPVVFGLFRLTIALPSGFTERFEKRQQEAILAHELAHLAARDPLWYLLADALVSVLWWHPLVWVARARLQVASELAADEACVLAEQGPETLAECLVSIAKEMHGPGAMESIGIEGSGFRSRLGQRVERLLQLSTEMVAKPALWRIRLVKVGVPVLLMSLLVVGTGSMRKDGNAPWSGVVNGAWDTAVGAVRVEEEDIRRDPRHLLMVTQVEKSTGESVGRAEEILEPLVSQTFTLKHVVPTDLVLAVQTAITDARGKILADDRAKKLLINSVNGDMKNAEEIIGLLDVEKRTEVKITAADPTMGVEAERRAALTLWDELMRRARMGQSDGKLYEAAILFEEAFKLSGHLNASEAQEKKQMALKGAIDCRMALARQLLENNETLGLDYQLNELLRLDPENQEAKELRNRFFSVETAKKSGMPRVEAQKSTPMKASSDGKVEQLVREAKGFYDARILDEAEGKLREAMKLDPANRAAYYYMNLVKEAQYGDLARKRDIEQRSRIVVPGQIPKYGPLPVPNPYVRTNGSQATIKSRQRILAKLDQMVIKELYFDGKPLADVVQFLQEESVKLDPERKGINFIINSNLEDQAANGAKTNSSKVDLEKAVITIKPPLKNLRMMDALDAVSKVAIGAGENGLAFMVEDYAVVFRQRVIEPPQLFTRIFKIDGDTFIQGLEKVTGKKVEPLSTNLVVSGGTNLLWKPVTTNNATVRTEQIQGIARKFFKEQGVNMETNAQGGAATQIFFNDRTGVLMARASLADLEIIREWVEKFSAEAGKQLEVNDTKEQWANRDREALSKEKAPPGLAPPPRDQQMKKQDDERITKVFKVDPDSTVNGFREMMKKSGFASTNLQEMMREFIYRAGVNLSDNNTNGSVLFLNERTGVLLARAKPQEMQIIESAIEVLNIIPPQVQIEAQYIEVPEKVAEEMGLKWFANGLPPDVSRPVEPMRMASLNSNNFGIHIDTPQVPNHVSVLSPAQARELQARLDKAPGINRLSAPRVTTANKRQAQISVVDVATVVVGRTNRLVKGEAGKEDTEEPVFITDQVAMGPVLDVIPSVFPDGKSMRLDWVFSLTEFFGYDKPEKKGELPEPQVRRRQVSNQNVIQDGYTLVAGCGMADVEVKPEGKKGWFRSKHPKTERKMVLILMTVSLIDPAGNLVNPGK